MTNVKNISDYIICKVSEGGHISVLKLHKLLYYCQAWSLAFDGSPLFEGEFEAWVHGPVNREVYNRFSGYTTMYSLLSEADVSQGFELEQIDEKVKAKVDSVLEVYAPFTGDQLEEMTHQEDPWIEARGGIPLAQRCTNVLSQDTMRNYYKSRISS